MCSLFTPFATWGTAFVLRANLLSASAFRLAIHVVAGLLILLLIAGSVLTLALTHTLERQTTAQIEEETLLFLDIYQAKGKAGLIDSVKQLSAQPVAQSHKVGVFDQQKLHLGGQISLAPDFLGWQKIRFATTDQKNVELHAKATQVEGLILVVGRSTEWITQAKQQLIMWLVFCGVGLSIGILLLGYLASRRAFLQLNAMRLTLKHFADGDTQARIPVAKHPNQIDFIAQQMNAHLTRLTGLISSMQTTATAIAHDLKAPLSHAQIALYEASELSTQGQDPEPQINRALDELYQLNQTFETILRLSRLQTQTDISHFKPVDLNILVTDMLELLEPLAQQANIQLQFYPQPQATSLLCDEGMIKQLLFNLVNNALTHCPSQSKVSIAIHTTDERTCLLVKDNGKGIKKDDLERVLQPFTRLDSARSTSGNGLGLALVKAVADQHKAKLEFSDANPGLQVSVCFS